MRGVANALDLGGLDLAGLGLDHFGAQHAEVIGVDFVAIDNLVAHALLAGRHVVLQGQLVGRLVEDATVERQLDGVATVGAGDHFRRPVEIQVDFLGLAQAAAFEVVGLGQQHVLVDAQCADFGQAGDHHRSLEAQGPDTVAGFFQAALGRAAHGQLFPVGGVAGGEGLQVRRVNRQCEQSDSEEQGATHKIS
ncbi:hypothetical protein D3C84_572370 [compost metagenome]